MAALLAGASATLGACSPIHSNTRPYEVVVDTRTQQTEPDGAVLSSAHWRFEGPQLVVTIDDWQTCYREQVDVVEQRRSVTRTYNPSNNLAYSLTGVALAGAGAAQLIAEPYPTESIDPAAAGGLMLGAGLILQLPWLIDGMRARDTDELVRTYEHNAIVRAAIPCAEGEGQPERVTLTLPSGTELNAGRQADGTYRFDIPQLGALMEEDASVAWLSWGSHSEPISMLLSEYATANLEIVPSHVDVQSMRRYPGPCWVGRADGIGRAEPLVVYDRDGADRVTAITGESRANYRWQGDELAAMDLHGRWVALPLLWFGPGTVLPQPLDGDASDRWQLSWDDGRLRQLEGCVQTTDGRCDRRLRVAIVDEGRGTCGDLPGSLACPASMEFIPLNNYGMPTGALDSRLVFDYRADGTVSHVSLQSTGGAPTRWLSVTWDNGRPTLVSYASGHTIEMTWDEAGNLTEAITPWNNGTQRWTYDYSCWEGR